MSDLYHSQIERACAEAMSLHTEAHPTDDLVPALVGYCRGLVEGVEQFRREWERSVGQMLEVLKQRAELERLGHAACERAESAEADRAALVKVAREFFVCYPIHANRMAESLPPALLAEVKGDE